MKHIKLFENFEVVEPIKYGDPLNNKEINFLKGYNIMCPEFIQKDDNYYYIFDHRCENIKDVPLTYIHGVCSKYDIKKYIINHDLSIDVDGGVSFTVKGLTKIPLKFNKVYGDFSCSLNKLTTLEGSPKSVGGNFLCGYNNLTTLLGSPKKVYGDFSCNHNKLTTLLGSPKRVRGNFYCSYNNLTTLEGGPEYIGRDLLCSNNPLVSFEYKGIIKGKLIYNQ